jgi:hypothetical protein
MNANMQALHALGLLAGLRDKTAQHAWSAT